MLSLFKKRDEGNILEIGKSDRYHTVDDLIKRSQPSSVYYTFLILPTIIIASGLLINNTAIVIGGMLVTPVLTPILLFALGLSILELSAIRKAGFLMVISFLLIAFISWVLSIFFNPGEQSYFLTSDPSLTLNVYFLVALSAGAAATFAWSKKEMTDVLPGVAMAVTLVPPISLIGINLNYKSALVEFYLYVFIINLIGLIIGSFVVYLLLKFYSAKKEVEKEIESGN